MPLLHCIYLSAPTSQLMFSRTLKSLNRKENARRLQSKMKTKSLMVAHRQFHLGPQQSLHFVSILARSSGNSPWFMLDRPPNMLEAA